MPSTAAITSTRHRSVTRTGPRRDGVSGLVQRAGQPAKAAEDAPVAHEHGDRHDPARVVDGGEDAHERVPHDQRERAAGLRGQARLFLHRQQPSPEAEVQGEEQHRVHSGERGRDGGREHGTLQNRCIQDQRRKEVHCADHSDGKAAAEPAVFPPQGAKAQQQQHRPDGGEDVVQAQEVQGDRAQRHAEEDAVHGAPPRRHLGHDLLRRRVGDALGQHGLKVRVRHGLPRAVTHGPHLPTSCAAAFSGDRACPRPPGPSCPARPRSARWTVSNNTFGKTAPGHSAQAVRAHRAARRCARPVKLLPRGRHRAPVCPPGWIVRCCGAARCAESFAPCFG